MSAAPQVPPSAMPVDHWSRRQAVLAAAYQERRCFMCGELGWCRHREPEIEMAIAASYGIGGQI